MGACERPTKADQAPPGSKESPNVSSWPMQQFYSAEEMSVQAKLPEGRVIDRTQSSQPAEGHPIEMPATSPDEYGVARHHNDSRCALCCPHDSSFAAAICCISMLPLPCWVHARMSSTGRRPQSTCATSHTPTCRATDGCRC